MENSIKLTRDELLDIVYDHLKSKGYTLKDKVFVKTDIDVNKNIFHQTTGYYLNSVQIPFEELNPSKITPPEEKLREVKKEIESLYPRELRKDMSSMSINWMDLYPILESMKKIIDK
jgi:hypothetical protein